jgi:adenylate cyclase
VGAAPGHSEPHAGAVTADARQRVEIERKFLLAEPPDGLDDHPRRRIEQGYLAIGSDGVEVRVRRCDGDTTLTVKSAPGLVRVEEEIVIDGRQFDSLWELSADRRIAKTRYLVPLGGGLTAEVDVYDDALRGLLTAEIEFPSTDASLAFRPPPWLGPEVTGDEAYANRSLAVSGVPARTGSALRS